MLLDEGPPSVLVIGGFIGNRAVPGKHNGTHCVWVTLFKGQAVALLAP